MPYAFSGRQRQRAASAPLLATEPPLPSRRLLDRVRDAIALRNYSVRTEEVYVAWVKRFVLYHGKRHPQDLGPAQVEAFLTHLALEQKVGPSTQNQALCALLFLYRDVLGRDLPWMDGFARAKLPAQSPAVLSQEEVAALLANLDGTQALMAQLLYGAGLRVMECLKLRIKDVDFEHLQIAVRAGKGNRDRVTILPACLVSSLRHQLARVTQLHRRDLQTGFGATGIPGGRRPDTGRNLGWQYVFPSGRIVHDPVSGLVQRAHRDPQGLQRGIRRAARIAKIHQPVGCHALRHAFATHLLMSGEDIRTVQELLGHKHVSTTMRYTHVIELCGRRIRSPLQDLPPPSESGRGASASGDAVADE